MIDAEILPHLFNQQEIVPEMLIKQEIAPEDVGEWEQGGTRPIFCDETENESSWKMNKWTSPRLRLFDNQKWNETGTRPRVSCL